MKLCDSAAPCAPQSLSRNAKIPRLPAICAFIAPIAALGDFVFAVTTFSARKSESNRACCAAHRWRGLCSRHPGVGRAGCAQRVKIKGEGAKFSCRHNVTAIPGLTKAIRTRRSQGLRLGPVKQSQMAQGVMRAIRPPRRFCRRGVREGNSSMMAARASGVSRDQPDISSMLRIQPTQSRSSGWMTQSLTQGDWISSRFQISSAKLYPPSRASKPPIWARRSSAPCKI